MDYAKAGLRCGIEIHQRLATEHKLFCECGTLNESEEPVGEFFRRQRAVAGELGVVDAAAAHEQLRNRRFVYKVYPSYCCAVDADEEPPHALNEEALDAALMVALLLNAEPVDEVQVMRKSVLDGSNTGGFQRTAIVALNGWLETSKGRVTIPTVSLEEEASAIQEDRPGEVLYRLDRLGIPLVEIGTGPEIADPEHAREVAERIGMLLRATGKVQRGIGTIRQDVNISVEGGARIEIKGAQELEALPKIVANEAARQLALLEIRDELRKRGAKDFPMKAVDVSDVFADTDSKLLKNVLEGGGAVLGMRLPKFAGLLGRELYKGRRLGTELADYAKAHGIGGLIHSDEELRKYGISEREASEVRRRLELDDGDAFVLIAGKNAKHALEDVHRRAVAALHGVPEETRKVVGKEGTAYMRPLPGGARLYPETDIPPVRITPERLERLRSALPEKPEVVMGRLSKMLNRELAEKIARSRNLPLFQKIVAETKADPMLVASTLEETLVSLRREGISVNSIREDTLLELFREYRTGLFVKAAVPEILKAVARKPLPIRTIVDELKLRRVTGEELEKLLSKETAGVKDKAAAMKQVMAKYRLVADGKEVIEILKRL